MFSTLFLNIPRDPVFEAFLKDFDQMMKTEISQSVEDRIVEVKEGLNGCKGMTFSRLGLNRGTLVPAC